MTASGGDSIHASAVLVGDRAVLIRGPSGSGKSRLAFDLILAGRAGQIPAAMLVGDDRVYLEAAQGHLLVRPARELAGLIEIRGLGIRRCDFAEPAAVGLVVDLAAADAERMPVPDALAITVCGVIIPRIPVSSAFQPFSMVAAALCTQPSEDCSKGIGNHIRTTIATR
ncbi:HPr kinase/phosphorylase [uncultured Bradyrhizobium sp.]|uniref:HPr kinase/phosphorylase n=1 Tax=uncultured Bradyrhizobium sp. TaxID=199684 RepID=UPI0035CA9698